MGDVDDRLPVGFRRLGERDEVCCHEHARDAFDFGDCVCSWIVGRFSGYDGRWTTNRHSDAELQCVGVGCSLDLYRHDVAVGIVFEGVEAVLETIDAIGIGQW